ncbi:MAG: hypothetical protein K6T78_11625 [Alicyclobacillus sp.]|nr:hypothetical protein [Alicyclobacillus sp.]
MQKRPWAAALATATAFAAVVSAVGGGGLAAFAANQNHTSAKPTYQLTKKTISWQGKQVYAPYGFVANHTTYLPIWYIMQTLDTMKITNQWSDTAWKITAPKNANVDLTKVSPGTGSISIYLNGTVVQKVDRIVYTDPSSGKPTTYLPIWYIMQVLKRLNIHTDWDGTHWNMKPVAASGSGAGGSGTGSGGSSTGSGGSAPGGSTGSSGGSGSGSTGTGSPTPPPPADTNPQASQYPGAVTRAQMVSDMAAALQLSTASVPASSPYDDLPATSPYYAGDEAAVQAGLVQPFSASHFGAGDAVTLQDAEQLFWNDLGITASQAAYQPGITLDNWASLVGLTHNLSGVNGQTAANGFLTTADEQQLVQNVRNLEAGMVQSGNVIHVLYTPHNEWTWTFSGDTTASGAPIYTASSSPSIQQTIAATYAFFDGIQIQLQGDTMVVTMPVSADRRWFAVARSQDDLQYSTDGGVTWTRAASFDGLTTPVAGSSVELKVPVANGLSITFNNMNLSADGSISLGWVNIAPGGAAGVTVQRVTLT